MSDEKEIHWDEIHRKIDAVRVAIEQGLAPTADEERRILKDRALTLAREPEKAVAAADFIDLVEFELANERYGIELTRVREVCLLKELTPVPCTPPFVLGIINLRGEIRTVINLKEFFGLPGTGISDLNKIIMIYHDQLQIGILADVIRGVRSIALSEMQPTLPTLTGVRADYLRGVTDDRLVVLDAAKILSDERIVVYEEVEA